MKKYFVVAVHNDDCPTELVYIENTGDAEYLLTKLEENEESGIELEELIDEEELIEYEGTVPSKKAKADFELLNY